MDDEYLFGILLCYLIYPLSIYDLFNVLFLNKKSETLLKGFIISILVYIIFYVKWNRIICVDNRKYYTVSNNSIFNYICSYIY